MTTRAPTTSKSNRAPRASVSFGTLDELVFQNEAVSLCLLVNRRHRTLRVIDFRAGPTLAKRNFVLETARREGVEKVFTLVERDEVGTWTRLGFTREGNIPSFYKRSDAWLLGAVVSQVGPVRPESEFDDDDDDDFDDEPVENPALVVAEKTINAARKLLKKTGDKALPRVLLAPAKPDQLKKALLLAHRGGRCLTGFEPFGRDAEREHWILTARGNFTLAASWEMQHCFGNSFFELLTAPQNETERLATISAIGAVCDHLHEQGAVTTFTIAPADELLFSAALLAAGFRKSAVLAQHIIVGGERKDAIVWAKRLSVD